jgi:mono/diheme cytochrome c family protein
VRWTIVAVAWTSTVALGGLSAQQPKSGWDGIYSDAQAKRGQALYAENCISCHGTEQGTPRGPAIVGPAFAARWQPKPIQELFDFVQAKMPYNSPGGLTRAQNADIIAFMLQQSHVPGGANEFVPPPVDGGQAPTSTARGLPFYTDEQAVRGRFAFERNCARCHSTAKNAQKLETLNSPHTDMALNGAMALSFGTPFLQRIYLGQPVYPSVFYLYEKMQAMPAFDTLSITQQTRADIIAYILKQNDFPPGHEELRPNPESMKQMMLTEPGFERLFNGKDLSGMNWVLGSECDAAPKGCGKSDPSIVAHVEDGKIVCTCNVHGYWYSEKKYQDFDLRLQQRFIKPAEWSDSEDDELYFPGGGVLLFIYGEHKVWPKTVEIELRWHDLGDVFPFAGKVKFTYDHAAKVRAARSPWVWHDIRIVSKNGRVESYFNGQLVSTITEHDFPAGYIGMQVEGTPTEWRNIRVKDLTSEKASAR